MTDPEPEPKSELSDAQLVARWRAGDRDACEALFHRHYSGILRFFRSKIDNHAHDLCQRTFLTCLRRIEGLRDPSRFRSYAFGIAYNVFREHLRSSNRDRLDFASMSAADLGPSPSALVAQRAGQRVLAQAMRTLPLDMQIVLELHYWEAMNVAELATVLDIAEGTAKSRLHRARARLREQLNDRLQASAEPIDEAHLATQLADLASVLSVS